MHAFSLAGKFFSFFSLLLKTKLVLIFYVLCMGIMQAFSVEINIAGDTTPHYRLILYIKFAILVNKNLNKLVIINFIYYNYTIYWVFVIESNKKARYFYAGDYRCDGC